MCLMWKWNGEEDYWGELMKKKGGKEKFVNLQSYMGFWGAVLAYETF